MLDEGIVKVNLIFVPCLSAGTNASVCRCIGNNIPPEASTASTARMPSARGGSDYLCVHTT